MMGLMKRTLVIAFVVASSIAGGCGEPPEPETYAYAFYVAGSPIDVPEPVPLLLDGRPLGDVEVVHDLHVSIANATWVSGAALTTPAATTCGDEALAVVADLDRESETHRRDDIRRGSAMRDSIRVAVTLPAVTRQTLYVDNRDGTVPALVTVGSLALDPVAPGAAARMQVTVGGCPEARVVRVAGVEVGTMDTSRFQLIDAVGGHCYEHGAVVYGAPGAGVRGASEPARLPALRVQAVPGIDYLVEEPPTTISSTRTVVAPVVLRHTPCR